RSGAWTSAATLGRNRTSRITRATLSTTSPADAITSSARDSQDGPSRNAPVEMMPVAIRPGPRLRDQDADHVPGDGRERAVVEQRATPLEQAPLLQLGGAAGPAELIVPPPPDVQLSLVEVLLAGCGRGAENPV